MRLDQLVAGLPGARVVGDAAVEVKGLEYDSRKVDPGSLFFCVVGEKVDGHEFGARAVEDGAAALVVERELTELAVPQVVVESSRAAMAPLAARFWGDPTAQLRVIGVTGTNGKTTTAFLVREILQAADFRCGLLGTVKQVVGGVEKEVERTTPEAIELQRTFRQMLEGGDEACAMEVSSHALSLHRADAIHFEVALFTNLTQDHLDFHADMEDYFRAKRKLFEMAPGKRIVNVDDPYGKQLAKDFECVTFSVNSEKADLVAHDVRLDSTGASFEILEWIGNETAAVTETERPPGGAAHVRIRLPGRFNVSNALAAFAAARALGIGSEIAAAGLAKATRVPGRLEPIDEGQEFAVLVDYAHTPDSLENVLGTAREFTEGKLIAVFGAGGDRDRDKRPKMGRAGAELSDLTVVTSDNPRSEDPEAIVAEVAAGAEAAAGASEIEVAVDRRAAIALALGRAQSGDTVVIAGKGHEQGQEFEGGRKIPFDDREVAREELWKLGTPA